MKALERDLFIVKIVTYRVRQTIMGMMKEKESLTEFYFTNLGLAVKNTNKYLSDKYSNDYKINQRTARLHVKARNQVQKKWSEKGKTIQVRIIRHFMNRDI